MSELGGRVIAYIVLGAIAAILLVYGFSRLDAVLGAKDSATTAASIADIAQHKPLARFRAALKARQDSGSVALAQDRTAQRRLLDSIAVLLADTLDSAGQAKPVDVGRVGGLVQRLGNADSSSARDCSIVVLTCNQRAANAEAETERLTRQLDAQTKVRDHPCGVDVTFSVLVGKVYTGGTSGFGGGYGLAAGVGCRVLRVPFF